MAVQKRSRCRRKAHAGGWGRTDARREGPLGHTHVTTHDTRVAEGHTDARRAAGGLQGEVLEPPQPLLLAPPRGGLLVVEAVGALAEVVVRARDVLRIWGLGFQGDWSWIIVLLPVNSTNDGRFPRLVVVETVDALPEVVVRARDVLSIVPSVTNTSVIKLYTSGMKPRRTEL